MLDELLSYDEALRIMRSAIQASKIKLQPSLNHAGGRPLGRDILATTAHPKFDNSAVDGFAVCRSEDAAEGSLLRIEGAIPAGSRKPQPISSGAATRIFTGAPAPYNCYGIIMQEDVSEESGLFVTLNSTIERGQNIRRAGSDFRDGDVLVAEGTQITPGVLALIASQGLMEVEVFEPPRVGVVATGDELVPVGRQLEPHQVFDSNTPMLSYQAVLAGAKSTRQQLIADEPTAMTDMLERATHDCDLVVISGGSSVGIHDHVPTVIGKLGEILFHGVAMRPGKPVLFGKVRNTFVFGLPGNPASAFVCFELFVREAIRRLAGFNEVEISWQSMPYLGTAEGLTREEFARCKLRPDGARPIHEQASFGIRSLAECDCLVRLPMGQKIKSGDLLPTTLLFR
jgi:molybdopterin molybdotransferase